MIVKKPFVTIAFFIFALSIESKAQNFYIYIGGIKKEIDSIYYKSTTGWSVLTPYAFVTKRFSPDYGENWERAGMLGQNLRPYIQNNPNALKNLNTYSTIRLVGIAQMFVIAPIFLIKEIQWTNEYNKTGPPYEDIGSPGYIWGFVGFLYSGAITYHLISKPFFKNAMYDYYSDKKTSSIYRKYKPNLGLTYNIKTNYPMVSLSWNF
ncbi:MAG: hypothetical protein KAT68_14770 [Bacteroidales bacterium]|nr:hypothetical protein [Bacteroidales bacterium]